MSLAYKLVCELSGHDADVRSVCALESGVVCSGSRDASVRVWVPAEGNTFKQEKALYGHEHWVAALLPVPRSDLHPRGSVYSAGHDKKIILWDIEKGSSLLVLTGHTNVVSSLSLASNGDLVSGSWDQTVRVWRNGECIQTLAGHEAAIWAVLAIPNSNLIISASADKTIRLWRDGKLEGIVRGHTDAVRGLVSVPGIGFASAANDTTIRLWSLAGQQLQEMHGHAEYIYTLAINVPDMQDSLADMLLISGGEERAVKVWKGQESIQTLPHPGVVWSVAVAPHTGEIISGCSDHVIRVWSQIPSRQAPIDVQTKYNELIQMQSLPKETAASGVDMSKLPGPDWLLANTGKRDGENKMIKEGSSAVVYMWSAANNKWEKIGTVVDGPAAAGGATGGSGGGGGGGGTLGKPTLHGKEYDFVFTVDVDDGLTHKLGYNRGENSYEVAQQFIYDNDLSQGMLDRIAQFIDENTGGNQAQNNYVDQPFFDPLSGAAIGVYPTDRAKPNAASAFPPQSAQSKLAHTAPPAAATLPAALKTAEPNVPVSYTAQLDPILKKVEEFSSLLAQAPETKALALTQADTERLRALVNLIKETNRYHASQLYDGDLHLILKLLSWPAQRVWPALDLLRYMWLHPQASEFLLRPQLLSAPQSNILGIVLALLKQSNPETFVKITGLRTFVNLFVLPAVREHALRLTEQLLDVLPDMLKDGNKLVRFAAITLLLNFSAHFVIKPNPERKIQAMSMLCEQLPTETDPENAFRALTTLFALMWHDESVKGLAGDLEVKVAVERINATITLPKVKETAGHVLALLR